MNEKMNVYEIITGRILEQLEKGVIPWQKPWKDSKNAKEIGFFPCFPLGKKKPYDILNQMLLDFHAGHYATYKQIKKLGGNVKKGEKSQIIAGWIYSKEERKDADGNTITDDDGNVLYKDCFALRYFNVFNVEEQTEGLDLSNIPEDDEDMTHPDVEPHELAEMIINGYVEKSGVKFTRDTVSNRAYYSPCLDEVVIPHIAQFKQQAEYYSTAFHELTHSTMKKDRCNREEDRRGKNVAFGSEEYSKEELVAELGAGTLVNYCGLETESSFNNSASYIAGWSKKLKEQPKMIVYASAQAQKAIDYILATN